MENEIEERCKDIVDKLIVYLNREEIKWKMF